MTRVNDPAQVREAARQAIDEDALIEVLELAAGDECERAAAEALREVAVDEVVADALAAATHARRRGRTPTGDDVGDAADRRRGRCGPSPDQPTHLYVESP